MNDDEPRDAPRAEVPRVDPPRVDSLSELLAHLDALRTGLSTDLTLAAAALEAGAEELALDLVDDDVDSLADFRTRALASLSALDAQAHTPTAKEPTTDSLVPARVAVLPRSRTWAAPAVAAAAVAILVVALLGVATRTTAPEQVVTNPVAASSTLDRLAGSGASAGQLRAAAQELNLALSQMVADSGDDPQATQLALSMLAHSRALLGSSDQRGALGDVLAQSAELERQLRSALPGSGLTGSLLTAAPQVALPTVAVPSAPDQPQDDPKRRPSTRPRPSAPSPAPAPQPDRQPQPQPTRPATSPSPTATALAPADREPSPAPPAPSRPAPAGAGQGGLLDGVS